MIFSRKPVDLATFTWPASRLGEALELLARKSNLLSQPVEAPLPPQYLHRAEAPVIGEWLTATARPWGLETEAIEAPYAEVERMIRGMGPGLLRLPARDESADEARFLVILKGGWRWITVITPDFSLKRVSPDIVRTALCQELEEPVAARINHLLEEAGVPSPRQAKARRAILREQLSAVRIGGGWLLRLSPGADLWKQAQQAKLPRYLSIVIITHTLFQLLTLLAWTIVGRGALQGYFDWVWLWAYALILLTAIPFQVVTVWFQNQLVIGIGGIFKQRLLYGTLKLDPEEIRHQGAGQFLGRVMEAEAVELLALSGGFMGVVAVIQLTIAVGVLALGAGGILHALLLVSWTLLTLLLGWLYLRRSRQWIASYRQMTNDLVERMVGHRTRLAQESRSAWHTEEDQTLNQYLKLSRRLDQIAVQLNGLIGRGWLILGLAGVAYTFVTRPYLVTELAISLGGVIMAFQALTQLVMGIVSVVGALLAWEEIAPLFKAATRPQVNPSAAFVLTATPQEKGIPETDGKQPVLAARDLTFCYPHRAQPVLKGCNLNLYRGDRLLLEGPSGGGKSTLAALLTGLRQPESGLLLLWGFDQQTIGLDKWRQHIISAPQFHENHVLTETFAFNLLMGRGWPPSEEDFAEAELVCHELGLGELLSRMPAGLQQMVGESGWQLSHGERSRLYIARALLQKADLIILDESFAALDPENLERALRCVLNRAPTLVVIAHP